MNDKIVKSKRNLKEFDKLKIEEEVKRNSILQPCDSNKTPKKTSKDSIKTNNTKNPFKCDKLKNEFFREKKQFLISNLKFIIKTEQKKSIKENQTKPKLEKEVKKEISCKKESSKSTYSEKHWREEMIEDLFEYEKCYFIKLFQVVLSFDSKFNYSENSNHPSKTNFMNIFLNSVKKRIDDFQMNIWKQSIYLPIRSDNPNKFFITNEIRLNLSHKVICLIRAFQTDSE